MSETQAKLTFSQYYQQIHTTPTPTLPTDMRVHCEQHCAGAANGGGGDGGWGGEEEEGVCRMNNNNNNNNVRTSYYITAAVKQLHTANSAFNYITRN